MQFASWRDREVWITTELHAAGRRTQIGRRIGSWPSRELHLIEVQAIVCHSQHRPGFKEDRRPRVARVRYWRKIDVSHHPGLRIARRGHGTSFGILLKVGITCEGSSNPGRHVDV